MRIENFSSQTPFSYSPISSKQDETTKVVARKVLTSLPTIGFLDSLSETLAYLVSTSIMFVFNKIAIVEKDENIKPKETKLQAMLNHQDHNGDTAVHTGMKASKEGSHYEMCKLLLEKGADPNITDNNGNTALHAGIKVSKEGSHYEMCRLLLEKGADPNIADHNGNTPLDTAIQKKDKKMIELLKIYKARSK